MPISQLNWLLNGHRPVNQQKPCHKNLTSLLLAALGLAVHGNAVGGGDLHRTASTLKMSCKDYAVERTDSYWIENNTWGKAFSPTGRSVSATMRRMETLSHAGYGTDLVQQAM